MRGVESERVVEQVGEATSSLPVGAAEVSPALGGLAEVGGRALSHYRVGRLQRRE